jgi:histidyl-tRNA synthetase
MALSKLPYKGTRDFFPVDKRVQNYLFNNMKEVAELYGYEDYNGPILEEVELYKAKSGEELINEQIYSFTDRGERFVAIRPEMTPTVARMVAQVHKEYPKPLRWYSIPNFMRYEKPQKGRLREFWQLNCDIFGAAGRSGEIEMITLLTRLFNKFGADFRHFEIIINDRQIIDSILKGKVGASNEQALKLYKIIDRSAKITKEALEKQVSEVGLNSDGETIFFDYLNLKGFEELFAFLNKNGLTEQAEEFSSFISTLNELELRAYIKFDPTIVRGLDYYTGIVFEVYDKHPDNRRALCGGGAYANLLQIFNEEPVPGVGFGLGDVTLKDFLTVHGLMPDLSLAENDLFLTYQTDAAHISALKLAESLREQNVKVVHSLESIKIKKVFQTAEKKGARFVIMIGDDELRDGLIQLKNLKTKEQFSLGIQQVKEIAEIIKG